MAVRVWLPPDFEEQLLQQVDAYRRRVATVRQQMDVGTALRLADYADAWPHMEPTAAVALASAGADPLGAAAQELALRSARVDTMSGRLGQLVTPPPADPTARPRAPLPPAEERSFGELGLFDKVKRGVSNAVGGAARNLFMTLGSGYQEVSAGISSLGEAIFDQDDDGIFGDAWRNYTQNAAPSELRLAIGEYVRQQGEGGWSLGDIAQTVGGGVGTVATLGLYSPLGFQSDEVIGSGLTPGGRIGRAREEQKHNLQLDGTFVTPGRLVARVVSDPGKTPYDIVSTVADLAANVVLDPANYLIPGGAAGGRIASRVRRAEEAGSGAARVARTVLPGLVSAEERTALNTPEAVARFLPSRLRETAIDGRSPAVLADEAYDLIGGTKDGRRLVNWLVDEKSPSRIMELSSIRGRRGLPADVAGQLADADNADDVLDLLHDTLGARVRNVRSPRVRRIDGRFEARSPLSDRVFNTSKLPGVQRDLRGVRFAAVKPDQALNVNDPGQMVTTLANTARNAKLGEDVWRPLVDRVARIDPQSPTAVTEVRRATADLLWLTRQDLRARGVRDTIIRDVIKLEDDYVSSLTEAVAADLANPMSHYAGQATVAGVQAPSVQTIQQVLANEVPLPNIRELRRASSAFHHITTTTGWDAGVTISEALMRTVWAPLTLLRGALTVRAVAEGQGRIAASGLDGIFNHPFRWFTWMLADDEGRISSLMKRIGIHGQGGSRDVLMQLEGFSEAVGLDGMALLGQGRDVLPMPSGHLALGVPAAMKGQGGFTEAWAQQLGLLAADPQGRKFAELGREGYARWLGSDDPEAVATLEALNRSVHRHSPLKSSRDLRRHARDMERRVHDLVGSNTELLEDVAQGQVRGVSVVGEGWDSAKIAEGLAGMERFAPRILNGKAAGREAGHYDRFLNWAFAQLLGKPEGFMNRAPVFRQHFATRFREGIGYADDATRTEALQWAKQNLNIDMSDAPRHAEGAFDNLEDLKTMAGGYAADRVKDLLYDTTRRSQAADIMRLIFPFYAPWKNALETSSRLVRANPMVLERGRRLVDGSGSGDGFFYENDYGDAEFAFPVIGNLFNAVAGGGETASVGAVGSMGGLNLLGNSVIPGVGPVVSIPASVFLPDKPDLDWLTNQLFPYGRPTEEGVAGGIAESFTPPWLDRARAAFGDPSSDRVWGNRYSDVMRLVAAEGGYYDETGGIPEHRRAALLKETARRGKWLYAVSAIASIFTPTPTSFRFEAETPDGAVTFDALTREYSEIQKTNPDDASELFLERFGTNLGLLMQGRTYATGIRAMGTVGALWEREHPEWAEVAPTTLGVFAPQYADEDLDPGAYAKQFREGIRHSLTPEDNLKLYNNVIGQAAYRNAREQAEAAGIPSEQARPLLVTLREQLRQTYRGFDSTDSVRLSPDAQTEIDEITVALGQEPALAETPAGQGIARYLQLREVATDAAFAAGDGLNGWKQGSSPQMVALRAQLRQAAEEIIRQYPDFAVAYDRIFARELADDTATNTVPERRAMLPAWLRSS